MTLIDDKVNGVFLFGHAKDHSSELPLAIIIIKISFYVVRERFYLFGLDNMVSKLLGYGHRKDQLLHYFQGHIFLHFSC